jgi:hypothetical protein
MALPQAWSAGDDCPTVRREPDKAIAVTQQKREQHIKFDPVLLDCALVSLNRRCRKRGARATTAT